MSPTRMILTCIVMIVTSTSASANVGDPSSVGSLWTRGEVERLVQQNRIAADQVIELRPEQFVRVQRRALTASTQKVAFVGTLVIVCTAALCAMISRDHLKNSEIHRDGAFEVGPPDGGW